jgi:hypothetical protein
MAAPCLRWFHLTDQDVISFFNAELWEWNNGVRGIKEAKKGTKDEDTKRMKNSFFWDITPCSALKVNRRFGVTYCLYFQVE